MSLLWDAGKMIWHEKNVDVPGPLHPGSAYDLWFFPELGKPGRGVLVVVVILSFKFKDGDSKKSPGAKLTWTPQEKTSFMQGTKSLCESIWSEKHRLTTAGGGPFAPGASVPISDAGVVFQISVEEDMSFTRHSHWNVKTFKADDLYISNVCRGGGGVFTNGDANLDSLDLQPTPGLIQRAAAHEFGHMLGYRDEYPLDAKYDPNPNWLTDTNSIMNIGETVQERHYVFFADWLSKQFMTKEKGRFRLSWKVDGKTDMTNAKL